MSDLTKAYMKLRCDFGRQPMFCELGPQMCDSISFNAGEAKNYILRNPVNQISQSTVPQSQHEINTIRAEYTTTGMNHAEGGWPKDVNLLDPEATQRYRRKIEKDDNYIHCVASVAPGMEHYMNQNNAIDMYGIYYSNYSSWPPLERNSLRTVNVYKDEECRPVSSISWQPDSGTQFAVTYADVDYFRRPLHSVDAHLWNVENTVTPETVLTPPCTMYDLQYSPYDTTTLIGGLGNGQVAVWDRRNGQLPVNLSPIHEAHRDLVRNVLFINSKSGQEFFSGGPDGACKWWDIRNMSEPTEVMIIDVVKYSFDVQSMANSFGISVLQYEPTIPTRFMVGTENGHVVMGNRKGKSALEKLPGMFHTAHLGPIVSLENNPFFMKNFLTVGDWRLQVWGEDCRDSAVLWTPQGNDKYTGATWSPTRFLCLLVTKFVEEYLYRCSLFLSTSANGVLSAWDLLRRQHVPVLTLQLCKDPLLKIKIQDQGALAAVGSSKGNIYMVEMSKSMQSSDKNDKGLMAAILEREARREKILEARLREIRLKQKQEGSPRHSAGDITDPSLISDKDLIEATKDYMDGLKKLMKLFDIM